MPVTIRTGAMKYKDPTTGNYVDVYAHVCPTATLAEIQAIIDNYGRSEDTDDTALVVETEYFDDNGSVGFITLSDADEIAEAFTSGQSVIFHLPSTEDSQNYSFITGPDVYLELATYLVEDNTSYFGISSSFDTVSNGYAGLKGLLSAEVNQDGKIQFNIYLD